MQLDLHGIRHEEVDRLVENFVFKHQTNFPLTIITGLSSKMKDLVIGVLDRNKLKYYEGDYSKTNMGIITVEGFC